MKQANTQNKAIIESLMFTVIFVLGFESILSPQLTQSFTRMSVVWNPKFLFPKEWGWIIFGDIQSVLPLLAFSSSFSPIQAVLVITTSGRVYSGGTKQVLWKPKIWGERCAQVSIKLQCPEGLPYFSWSVEKFPLDWGKRWQVWSAEDLCWLLTALQGGYRVWQR